MEAISLKVILLFVGKSHQSCPAKIEALHGLELVQSAFPQHCAITPRKVQIVICFCVITPKVVYQSGLAVWNSLLIMLETL